MNARSLLIIVAALLVAGVTAFLARGWLSAERNQIQTQQVVVQQAPAQSVLVAVANLPIGMFLKEEHLRWQAWPTDATDPNYMVKDATDIAKLVGSVVRHSISAGEPIIPGKIVKPGDRGFLAAVLKPGMRAVTVGISETSGVSGLAFPGDRVDMLLTHALPGSEGESPSDRRAAETVLENVRVLAIGKRLSDRNEEALDGKTATIEVTPKQAEMVAVLVELGRVSLSLRSLGKPELAEAGSLVMSSADTLPDGTSGTIPGTVPAAMPGTAANLQPSPLADADATATADAGASAAAGKPESDDVSETPDDDNPSPMRGLTYTLDNEVSRLLTPSGGLEVTVHLQRGGEAQVITFK